MVCGLGIACRLCFEIRSKGFGSMGRLHMVASTSGSVPRRRFLAGMGAAAALPVALPLVGAAPGEAAVGEGVAAGVGPVGPSPFPEVPDGATTANQDRLQMLWQLGMSEPALPARAA